MFIVKKAQALTELAVFGSVMLMLLGILLHYGLKYNAQQQVAQEAFRKALGVVAKNIASGSSTLSASYTVIDDVHITSPENPFGMGSVVPITSQASVMRNHRTMDGPTNKNDLPKMYMDIAGQYFSAGGETRNYFYTAAYRDEKNVPMSDITKDYDCDGDGTPDEGVSKYGCVYGAKGTSWSEQGVGECSCEKKKQKNPETGDYDNVCPLACETVNIRIVDDCDGEIVNLETVDKRCHQISEAGINVPWYCDAVKKEKLFDFSSRENPSMGLQQDYTQKTKAANTLEKEESTSSIKTIETLDWRFITDREIIYNDNIGSSGISKGNTETTSMPATSVLCHNGRCEAGKRNPKERSYTTTW